METVIADLNDTKNRLSETQTRVKILNIFRDYIGIFIDEKRVEEK